MSEIYIPQNTQTLKDKVQPQIRLGLQGWPGTGKTHSALTFPSPFVVDFDNNLQAYFGQDIPNLPIWDANFVSQTLASPPKALGRQPNRRDAFLKFLKTEALKLTANQTLIIDSWSAWQDAIDAQSEAEPEDAITKGGAVDTFVFWNKKLKYSREAMQLLCSVRCNVVVCFHEKAERDPKSGQLLDKLRPLQQGQFVSEIQRFFNFFFRCVTEEVKDTTGKVVKTNYFWQVASDNQFESIARPAFPDGVYRVPANYSIFQEYRKQS